MLALSNHGSQSAHFAIYPYGGELAAPSHLDVHHLPAGKSPSQSPTAVATYRRRLSGHLEAGKPGVTG
ncbi:hypothetical protein ACIA58_14755 [Kribbella sp. NPDC051586]|uniref:hypothetical protein n=1 Tax=Kribbella sp. NPDC051586 TaxID=3364118 RepID=UPI00378BDD58